MNKSTEVRARDREGDTKIEGENVSVRMKEEQRKRDKKGVRVKDKPNITKRG